MNIFSKFFNKITLPFKILSIVKEAKKVYAENSETAEKIKEIIDDLIKILEKIKAVVPAVDKAVEAIIEVIKKWFGKTDKQK